MNKTTKTLKMFKKFNNKLKKRKNKTTKILRPAIKTKISPNYMTDENLELLGLRLQMLAVDCGEHEKYRVLKKVPNYVYYANNLDYDIVKTHNIYERLSASTFAHYSSILIFINCQNERCRRKSLCTIIKAIRRNKDIRNQLKLIWASYKGYSHAFTPDILFDSMFKDFLIFKTNKLENTFLFQDHFEREIQVLLHLLTTAPFTTAREIQQILKCQYLVIQLKSSADLYFYGVNPALAIIFNNYYFTNSEVMKFTDNDDEDPTRTGSKINDVLGLISTFIETRTPFILINDINRDQLLGWIKYLCRKDMKNLQNLYFFTMTHGRSNNTIYTNDGEIDFIKDIVRPIEANVTLRNTNVTFINVHCRGGIFAYDAALCDFDNIPSTRIEELPYNMSIIFSVPESTISPRYPTKGTPVIKSFNKIYCNLDSSANVRILHEKIWSLVKKDPYYECLDNFKKSTELVEGNCSYDDDDGNGDKKEYKIKPIPTNPKKILPLLSSFEKDCPNLDLECKLQEKSSQIRMTICITSWLIGILMKSWMMIKKIIVKMLMMVIEIKKNITLNRYLRPEKGKDFKNVCLYSNVNKNELQEMRSQINSFSNGSDDDYELADKSDGEYDSDEESNDDQENKCKDADDGNRDKKEYNIKSMPTKPMKSKDFKNFCLYSNVNKNELKENGSQITSFSNELDDDSDDDLYYELVEKSDDEWENEWDSDEESDEDQESKRKDAEIEFRKLILPFMGSTILQDENIFALDHINREDEDIGDDFGAAILDYRTLIKAFDYELGIAVKRY